MSELDKILESHTTAMKAQILSNCCDSPIRLYGAAVYGNPIRWICTSCNKRTGLETHEGLEFIISTSSDIKEQI